MSSKILSFMESLTDENAKIHPFYLFEPWDVEERDPRIFDMAKEDDCQLNNPEIVSIVGKDPHPFQSGYIFDDSPLAAMFAANQCGKALPLDTKIYTKRGYTTMRDISVGDKVLTPIGSEATVVGTFDQGVRPVYKLTFDDDTSCECDENHLWKVLMPHRRWAARSCRWKKGVESNPIYNKWEVMPLKEIISRIGTGVIKPTMRPCIPVVGELDFEPSKKLLIDPYVIGVLLGDGCLRSCVRITCDEKDSEIIDRVRSSLDSGCSIQKIKSSKHDYSVVGCTENLIEHGVYGKLSCEKYIPDEYKYTDRQSRIDILRGLMDTDGSVYGHLAVEFASKSKRLAEDVVWLVQSLGGKAKIKEKQSGYKNRGKFVDCGIGYRVTISSIPVNPFFLKRKADRFYHVDRTANRIIRSIEYVRDDYTRCIKLDSEDGLFVIDNMVVTHNTYSEVIDDIIMLTGELPFSLRIPKGQKTDYKREITKNNVKRFGRFDAYDGEFLDKKWKEPDGTWDCGTVVGAGIYPKNKIAPYGSKIWIVTSKQIRDETWWPAMRHMIPDSLIDKTKANLGFDNREFIIHLARDSKLNLKTYEQKADRLEGSGKTQEYEKLHKITFDEEPPDQKFLSVALVRCAMVRLITTPYKGLSWTYDRIFKQGVNVYHCTQYDCPYQDWNAINTAKKYMPKWEIGARIYGLHTGQAGRPYYEGLLDLISKAIADYRESPEHVSLMCTTPWENIPELLIQEIMELDGDGNNDTEWLIYEPKKEDGIYFLSVDTAEGTSTDEDRTDANAAHVFRFPIKDEKESWPVHVASIRTKIPADEFARLCLYGAVYWNYAMLVPEAMGKSSGTFMAEIRDYPFIFTMNVINDRTRKQTERLGFFTTAKTRILLFDLLGSMMKDLAEVKCFGIRSKDVLKEISSCIVGKNGRPDHEKRGSNDSLIAYAIGLYAFVHCKELLKTSVGFMKKKKTVDSFESMAIVHRETRPMLCCKDGGLDGLRRNYGRQTFRGR